MSRKVLDGKVLRAVADVECGACGKIICVQVDPAEGPTVWDAVVEAVCNGNKSGGLLTSIQGGYLLCGDCTRKCDTDKRVPESRRCTRGEVRMILGID